jgi:glycosyltransferase involved in cell wall biosynthesis
MSGIPVVASDIAAIRECVPSQMEEYLCKPLDIKGIVKAVLFLAKSEHNGRISETYLQKFDNGFNFDKFKKYIYE